MFILCISAPLTVVNNDDGYSSNHYNDKTNNYDNDNNNYSKI